MASQQEERIVMTPKKKTSNSTTLVMERKLILPLADTDGGGGGGGPRVHVAGGSNAGIVVNKEQTDDDADLGPAHLSLEFRVFLINASTQRYTQEKRVLSYWFKDEFAERQRAYEAQEFFKELVSPNDFPRDYVGFIKKIMKLMQKTYPMICRIEVQLTQEKEMDSLPNRPTVEGALLVNVGSCSRKVPKATANKSKGDPGVANGSGNETDTSESSPVEEVKSENVLQAIEESYPNSLTVDDMAKRFKIETEVVKTMVTELISRQLIKAVGGVGVSGVPDGNSAATVAYRRVHQNEDQVTVVRQMPRVERALQPTIAVITSQYHEKMAVDAVMENKQTFVRYATVGEANVYTLGDLGSHRVVTTKLPMTGHHRDALIATGSMTTRLLGTFQEVEHVFLVGVGGAVPHFMDFGQHVRLGDVVISAPANMATVSGAKDNVIYRHCETVKPARESGEVTYETRSYGPPDLGLQQIALDLTKKFGANSSEAPWLRHFESALLELGSAEERALWKRPAADTDKLYMSVGGGDVIEVQHPSPKEGQEDPRSCGEPVLHLGPVSAGRQVALDEQLRQSFSSRHGTVCFGAELDAVVESIQGNRKEQYMLVRGCTDYKDGTRGKEWQQYAALMAAAVFRAIVEEMGAPV